MAIPVSLGQPRSRSAGGNRLDVVLQSRAPKYGIGRNHPKTAAGHGCIALLLLGTVKNGVITAPLQQRVLLPPTPCARQRATSGFSACTQQAAGLSRPSIP